VRRDPSTIHDLLTRRSLLKLGAGATVSIVCASPLIGCSSEAYDSEVRTELDPKIYIDPERDARSAGQVIKTTRGFNAKTPNIIFILTDDLGYGDLGCYGSTAIKTPNIDRLAHEGRRFTDFYSCSGLCSPSRAGLLTGRYPHRTGVTYPFPAKTGSPSKKFMRWVGQQFTKFGALDLIGGISIADGLPLSEITLAEALKLVGYNTACIGKWHLGDFTVQPDYLPRKHGFDYFIGFNGANDDWPVAFWRNETEIEQDIGLDQEHYTGLFHEEAIGFIERSKDQPFFLYLAHKDPHQPCQPSDKFAGSSKAGPHGDTIQEVDWSVGEILKYLERNGLDKNTMIVLTSDNGPWYDGSPGPLRGRKGQSYEGGYRVPMIAWWPGQIPPDSVCSEPAMNIDFFPTFLALAGLEDPSDRIIDGRNIWGLLTGKETETPHEALFFFHDNEIEGVRVGNWKYFRYIHHYAWPIPLDKPNNFVGMNAADRTYTYPSRKTGEVRMVRALGTWPLLYDMERDPGENYNVIRHHPEIARRLHNTLVDFEKEFYENPRGWIAK
jgi:uncharacterized sulfatase